MIIDAHQHCWQLGRHDCAWPTPDLEEIYRDYSPADFLATTVELGVTGSVLMQSQPSAMDTQYLLRLAAGYPHILGVVGWVDLAQADAPGQILALSGNPQLKGLRPMLQSLAPDDWILSCANPRAIEAMIAQDLVFDALIHTRHLSVIDQLAARYPDLRIVLNHAAKPDIAAGEWDAWLTGMQTVAARDNIWCKLSGLPTEMAPGQSLANARPYIETMVNLFAQRLIWGSDWPVLTLAADYASWLSECRTVIDALCPATMADIFLGNARVCYRLDDVAA